MYSWSATRPVSDDIRTFGGGATRSPAEAAASAATPLSVIVASNCPCVCPYVFMAALGKTATASSAVSAVRDDAGGVRSSAREAPAERCSTSSKRSPWSCLRTARRKTNRRASYVSSSH